MPANLIMRRVGDALTPVDLDGFEFINGLPIGKDVKVSVTQSRNIKLHRMYFGALQHLLKNQDLYSVLGDLNNDICIALGHYTMETYRGEKKPRAKSISFAKMDETDFRQFFEGFVKLACTRIAPNLPESELRAFYEILDGNQGRLGQPTTRTKAA